MKPVAAKTYCKDGTSLSIQASKHHYSTPRDDEGPYTAYEVGFISDANGEPITPPRSWHKYADGGFPADVYGWVPAALIERFIKRHGGRA